MKCSLAGAVLLASIVLISSRQAVHAEEIPQQYMDMVNRGLASSLVMRSPRRATTAILVALC